MPHFHYGKSEAETLIRLSPQLVESMLERARLDQKRWSTRLFQRDKKIFLEGYVTTLEAYWTAKGQKDGPPSLPIKPKVPVVAEAGPITLSSAEPVSTVVEPSPVALPSEVEVPVAPRPVPIAAAPASQNDLPDRSLGVWQPSGWNGDELPQLGESTIKGPPVPSLGLNAPREAYGTVTTTDWSSVFAQARGMGIVDLTAYDAIDQLGQLRELLDQWRAQNESVGPMDS